MLQARFVKQGTAVLFSCLLLTSCSDSQSPLLSFLEESNFNRPVVNLSDIYGASGQLSRSFAQIRPVRIHLKCLIYP